MRHIPSRVLCAIVMLFSSCLYAFAQTSTVQANFYSFYGATRQTQSVNVLQGTAGTWNISSGQTYTTAQGTVTAPSYWSNITGHATNMIPIQFTPNGTNGNFSGSFVAHYTNSNGNGPRTLALTITFSGDSKVGSATAGIKYQVLSILYTPPGNASSSGFSNATSAGTSSSYGTNWSASDTITFGGGFLGVNDNVSFTAGTTQGSSSSYTTNYQASSSAQLNSVSQHIDHTQDQVFILIDPTITVTQTGDTTGYFTVGPSLDATGNFGTSGPPADIVNVNIAGLKNPSLIPLQILEPQVVQSGTTLPGLSFICANPLPPAQCTQQNACGCTATDFAPIVAQDELASSTVDTTAPSSVDSSRFVYVDYISLQGPQQQGAAPVRNGFSISDSTVSSQTTSNGTSYGVGFSHDFGTTGFFNLGIKNSTTFTVSQTQTAGTSNGTAHTGAATMGTSDAGCFEYVDVYEDTTYHTFAYSLPQAAPANCQ